MTRKRTARFAQRRAAKSDNVRRATEAIVAVGDGALPPKLEFIARFSDGTLHVWPLGRVAGALQRAAYGHDVEDFQLYAWLGGRFEPVEIRQAQGGLDENDYIRVRVELVSADGAVLAKARYWLDGRA